MRARSISEASPIGTARAVRNLSRNSLTLGIIFGTAVTLLIGAGAVNNIQFESRALTRVFEEAAGRTVAGIAAGLSESVRNPSPNWTEPLDDYVAATPDIIAISVTGNGQDRFVSTGGGESFPPAPVLTIAHDIVFQGSKIGSVEVNFDRLHLAADIARVRVGTLRRAPLIWTGVMILVVLLLVYRQRHRRSADDNRQLRDEVRRRTAAEKQESAARARLEDIASLTSDFYWESDAEGIVRYVSQRFSAITGAVDDLVVGKAIGQGSWTPTAESGERIAEIFSKRLTVRNEPFRYTDKKGDLRVISGSAAPRFDEQGDYVGHRGTSREVTAEVEASRRLAASEQRFRNIAAMTADLFWETDPDGKLTFFLTKGDSRLSRAPDEVIGMHFLELVKEFAPDSLAEHERAINARQPFSGLRQDGHLPDGSPLHLVANGQPVFDAAGTYLGFQGATRDVTDLVLAEKRAATSTRQMESYLYNAPAAILIKDRELRFTHINRTYSAWSGRTLEMVLGKPITEIHGNSAKSRAYQEIDRHVLETGRAQIDEDTFTFDDGIERRVSTNRFPIFDDGGTVVGVGTFITDITEQYKAQEAAAGLSRQLEEFLNNSPSAIAIKDRDGRFTQVNGTWSALIGLPAADVIGKTNAEIRPDGLARNWIETQDRQSMATAAPVSGEHSVIAADGRSRRVSSVRYPLFDGRGEITHLASITTDITAQYEAQRQAAAATQQLVGFVENSPATIVFKDLDNRYVRVNKAFCDWTGMAEDELVGKTTAEIYGSDNARLLENMNRRAAETRDVVEGEHWISFPNGTARYVSMTRFPLFDESGAVYQVAAINVDITAEREARFQIDGILENSPSAIFVKDTKGQFLFANPTFTEWFGVPPSGVAGNTSHDLCPPEFADACADQDRKVLADSEPHEILLEVSFTDGERHWITMTKFPISAPDGTTIGIGTVNTDVTQVQRAEERLRQAHRLEAIGQLTGGVAHDFNNLLTVAQGNLELLEMTLSDSGQRKWLTAAIRAIQRGGSLTQQLLSFARKQTLAPSSISVAETVEHIAAMVGRVLRENITLHIEVADDLPRIEADPAQLESALLNLAINAQDAMPRGGQLTLSAVAGANAHFVRLCVADTGIGIPDNIRDHVLEPFFTTKAVGEGSGLGLSMVYGFVEQSGGDLEIHSEQGRGTQIVLSIPVAVTPVAIEEPAKALVVGKGRVLFVEDDPDLRVMAVQMMKTLGYAVDSVPDADSAKERLSREIDYDILLTDLVLPGKTSGLQLADHVQRVRPNMRIVITSGYADSVLKQDGGIPESAKFLPKPFRMAVLSEVLGDPATNRPTQTARTV